jgi:hypothetical protein
MDREQLIEFIVGEMRRYRKADDIIMEVCQRTNRSWNEVAPFVHKVMAARRDEIQGERAPLVVAIGIASALAGLGGLIAVVVATMDGWIVIIGGIPYAGNCLVGGFSLMLVVGGLQGILQMALGIKSPR